MAAAILPYAVIPVSLIRHSKPQPSFQAHTVIPAQAGIPHAAIPNLNRHSKLIPSFRRKPESKGVICNYGNGTSDHRFRLSPE